MFRKIYEIAYALISLILLLAFGFAVAHAQQGQIQSTVQVFIPAVYKAPAPRYSIQGKVVNQQNVAIAGVTIKANQGQQTTTGADGKYNLTGLLAGTYTITPSKTGLVFSPTATIVIVPPDIANVNFTASGLCTQVILNGGFEDNTAWAIPVTEYSAGYTTAEHHSGLRSMRTGIVNLADNIASDSTTEQKVTTPAGTTSALFTFWIKPVSGDAGTLSLPPRPVSGTPLDSIQATRDVQYVLILDSNFHIIDTLIWQLSNSMTWTQYQFNLAEYAGKNIWVHFGTTNDGLGGVTSMFVDDVSLDNCSGPVTPTPTPTPTPTATPTPCQELIINNNFEQNTGWVILDTAYRAAYSNAEYHSPYRSMRAGITIPADNILSYSDFRQTVTIPSTAHHVTLSAWMDFFSSGLASAEQPEQIAPTGHPFSETPLSDDIQYLLILDQNQNWIGTLVWQRSNTQIWTNMQFDLTDYAGEKVILQWGVYNNGTGGITSMFVDDASLQACP
jgi:hypothetical protein